MSDPKRISFITINHSVDRHQCSHKHYPLLTLATTDPLNAWGVSWMISLVCKITHNMECSWDTDMASSPTFHTIYCIYKQSIIRVWWWYCMLLLLLYLCMLSFSVIERFLWSYEIRFLSEIRCLNILFWMCVMIKMSSGETWTFSRLCNAAVEEDNLVQLYRILKNDHRHSEELTCKNLMDAFIGT